MSFPKIRITDAGKVMVAEALDPTSPKTIRFTKFKVGSGTATGNETKWDSLTDLNQPKLNVAFTEYTRNDDLVTLTGEFSNASVQTAFFWRELGIYGVQVDSSDNEGPETLMFYGNAGGLAEYVPAADAEVSVRHKWSTRLAISSAADVSAVVHSITYATAADLNAHIQDKTNPHKVTYEQAGAAPKVHTSPTGEYGIGGLTEYGHVLLSDNIDEESDAQRGIAATPASVYLARKAGSDAADAAETARLTAIARGFPGVYGTYKGNGSESSGVNLSFANGMPKVLFIMLQSSSIQNHEATFAVIFPHANIGFSVYDPQDNGGNFQDLIITTVGNTLNIKHASSPANGMNRSGRIYIYGGSM